MTRPFAALVLYAMAAGALAADAVKRIDVYVLPYYESAREPGGAPRIAVAKAYDALLASSRTSDVIRARDGIDADNGMITPMTLMVLAIRLYDVGLRDDAVFWFYVAKNRFATLATVADVKSPQLSQVEDATRNFALLAGPVINGYAFCDVENQQRQAFKAWMWTRVNPYKALFLPQIPALPGDRARNLDKAIAELATANEKESAYLAKPANVENLKRQRRENGADAKYCWKS